MSLQSKQQQRWKKSTYLKDVCHHSPYIVSAQNVPCVTQWMHCNFLKQSASLFADWHWASRICRTASTKKLFLFGGTYRPTTHKNGWRPSLKSLSEWRKRGRDPPPLQGNVSSSQTSQRAVRSARPPSPRRPLRLYWFGLKSQINHGMRRAAKAVPHTPAQAAVLAATFAALFGLSWHGLRKCHRHHPLGQHAKNAAGACRRHGYDREEIERDVANI